MILEKYVRNTIINGGDKFYILDSEQVLKAVREKKINLKNLFFRSEIYALNFLCDLEFANEYKNFEISYYYYSENVEKDFYPYKLKYNLDYDEEKWFELMLRPMLLYYINDKYERVHTECLACTRCGWLGKTATASVSDLYIESTNREINNEVFYNSFEIEIVKCPVCGDDTVFRRRNSIWHE